MSSVQVSTGRRVAEAEQVLRLAVDARVVQDAYHGIGRQTFELLQVLAARDDVQLDVLHGHAANGRLSLAHVADERMRLHWFDSGVASATQQLRWPRVLRRLDADILLVPYHLAVPWFSPLPVACFVHDCIFEQDRAYAPNARVRMLYRAATRIALARASCVLTVSEATRAELRRHYGITLPRENVISNGVGASFRRQFAPAELERARRDLRLPARYVLHVGAARPHKNRTVLVHALAHLRSLEPPVHLVLVGGTDQRFTDDAEATAVQLGLDDRVHRLENVRESILPAVYQGASCFAFPSKTEGFGLPVLEAMASRVPVVASDVPVVAEVAGDAALLVDPDAVAGWAAALRRVLSDERLAAELVERGETVSQTYTWAHSGERLVRALRRACS